MIANSVHTMDPAAYVTHSHAHPNNTTGEVQYNVKYLNVPGMVWVAEKGVNEEVRKAYAEFMERGGKQGSVYTILGPPDHDEGDGDSSGDGDGGVDVLSQATTVAASSQVSWEGGSLN